MSKKKSSKPMLKKSCNINCDTWNKMKMISYLGYGALIVFPALLIESWLVLIFGVGLAGTVLLIGPVVEEVLKALPILSGFTDKFEDRLYYVIIAGFMFGVVEWSFGFLTGSSNLTLGPLIHIVFMLPMLFLYNAKNKWSGYIGLVLNIMLHFLWNMFVISGGI